jgi:hypothetical protein
VKFSGSVIVMRSPRVLAQLKTLRQFELLTTGKQIIQQLASANFDERTTSVLPSNVLYDARMVGNSSSSDDFIKGGPWRRLICRKMWFHLEGLSTTSGAE